MSVFDYFWNIEMDKDGITFSDAIETLKLDCVLAFWDGQSHGTKFTLDYAKEKNKPIKIIQI